MSNKYLGTIASSGTTANNSTTGSPFTVPQNGRISVQPDVDGYVQTGAGSSTVATSTAVKVAADQLFDLDLGAQETAVAFLPFSGSAGNLKVYARTKR